MQIELLTLGIDAHDEVALAQVFPARHLLRIRPPILASLGHLGQHPLGERGDGDVVLDEDAVHLGLEVANGAEAADKVAVGVRGVDGPVVDPHHDPLPGELPRLRSHDAHLGQYENIKINEITGVGKII